MLYAPSLFQQGTMLVKDILNADLKIPTLTQLNAKLNLEWQENRYDKLISAIPIEWHSLIQSNTSTTIHMIPTTTIHCKINKEKATFFILHS